MDQRDKDAAIEAMRNHINLARQHVPCGHSSEKEMPGKSAAHAAIATAIAAEILVETSESIWASIEALHDRINRVEMSLDNIAANTLGRR